MNLSSIKDVSFQNKRILMRVDFNVEFDEQTGRPLQIARIESAKETIDALVAQPGVKLALLSHLGRPEGRDEKFSFSKLNPEIGKILGIETVFVPDCVGDSVEQALTQLQGGQVLMLENVRFYQQDSEGDMEFAKKLSQNFDVFVNDAFGSCHRDHSSVTKVAELLPSFAGLNLLREVENLEKTRANFQRPAVAIIGGAKIETKLPVINFFSENYDYVLIGGKIGLEAESRGLRLQENVCIPSDYVGGGLDIGPQTIEKFKSHIKDAKTIVWNGPMGKFETEEFAKGTNEILGAILENKDAYKVTGGGETIQVLEERNFMDKFNFVSTGGGAMLDFLVKGSLPGIESIGKKLYV